MIEDDCGRGTGYSREEYEALIQSAAEGAITEVGVIGHICGRQVVKQVPIQQAAIWIHQPPAPDNPPPVEE